MLFISLQQLLTLFYLNNHDQYSIFKSTFFQNDLYSRDIAMILCDPYATFTITQSVIQLIDRLMKSEQLPRVSF